MVLQERSRAIESLIRQVKAPFILPDKINIIGLNVND
jgi:hypothetical protein